MWRCNARIDQDTKTGAIRDCTHVNRNGPGSDAKTITPSGYQIPAARTTGLAGKLIGYDYKARAIARRRTHS